jgi:hypothetical protein
MRYPLRVIHLDDLLSARIVYAQRPELRNALADQLKELANSDQGGFRTLIGDLRRQGLLNDEQVEFVSSLVERTKRGRALGVYTQLLSTHAEVSREDVEVSLRSLGERASPTLLGDALVARGLADSQTVARLRYRAKQVLDHDEGEQIQNYLSRQSAESASTLVGGSVQGGEDTETALGEARIPTGVYRLELVMPTSAEATGIIDRASVDLTPPLESVAPRFPIPDWVNTNDPMVGKGVGRYRILGRVGAGAMGTVYLCDADEREQPICLKLLGAKASAEAQARFKREILANSFFSHENVIDVHDAGVTPQGQYFLAMDFFDGGDLEHLLKAEGSISLRQTLMIARQILLALEAAHGAGIVHRDIKPANILVAPGGTTAKLMDFGIALIKDLGEFKAKVFESDAGGVTGTPEYLAPEQAFRDPAGPASDLYSLGMVIFRCVTGRLPFECETVTGWVSSHMTETPLSLAAAAPGADFPRALQALLDRLFVKEPTERMQSAREVLEALDAIAVSLGAGRKSRLFGKFRSGL